MDERVSIPSMGRDILFANASRPAQGSTYPSIQRATGALSLSANLPKREDNQSTAIMSDVKNSWSYTSIHSHVTMALYLSTEAESI